MKRFLAFVMIICLTMATLSLSACNLGSLKFESLVVDKTTVQTEYNVGDALNFKDIKITVKYSDSKENLRIGFSDVTLEYPEDITATEGEKTVTVKYYDDIVTKEWQTVTFTINVQAAIVPHFTSMNVVLDSVKRQYYMGDALDFKGIRIEVKYENNDDVVLDYSDVTFQYEENVTATEGTKVITVKYNDTIANEGEKTCTFDIVVGKPTFKSFAIKSGSAPTSCYINETVDLSELRIDLDYEEGDAYHRTLRSTDVTITGLDTSTAGNKTVTVSYTDPYGVARSTTFTIEVKNPTVKGFSLVSGTYTTTYGVGDSAEFTGIQAKITYDNAAFDKTLAKKDLTLTYGDNQAISTLTSVEGNKVVTVSYVDPYSQTTKTATFNVVVELRFVSFIVDKTSVTSTYYVDDVANFDGIKVDIKYNNSSYNTTLTKANGLTLVIPENLTSTVGQKTITVKYSDPKFNNTERTATFNVTVAAHGFVSAALVTTNVKTTYNAKEDLDLSNLQFVLDYEDNTLDGTFAMTDTRITCKTNLEGITNTVGEKTITYTYEDEWGTTKDLELTITVVAPTFSKATINLNGFATTYRKGLDSNPTDFTAITLSVEYNNTLCNATLTSQDLTISGYENLTSTLGTKTITVSYKDFNGTQRSETFDVTVTGPTYDTTNSKVDLNGIKDNYCLNDVLDNFNNVKVDLKYTDEDYNVTLEGTSITVNSTKVDNTKIGTYEVTVSFQDPWTGTSRTLTFKVTIHAPELVSKSYSGVTTIYKKGDAVDFSTLAINLEYTPDTFNKTLSGQSLTYDLTGLVDENNKAVASKRITVLVKDPYTNSNIYVDIDVTIARGTVTLFERPSTFTESLNAKNKAGKASYGEEGFEGQFFSIDTHKYYVGDDNPFYFMPIYALEDEQGTQLNDEQLILAPTIKYNDTNLTSKIGKTSNILEFYLDNVKMVTTNILTGSYQFTSDAVGKDFTISVLPNSFYTFTGVATTIDVTILDAFNVYSAKDLCVLDNCSNHAWHMHGGTYGINFCWDDYKAANGYSQYDVKGIILQNNITLTTDDLPDEFFYTSKTAVEYKENGVVVETKPAGSKFMADIIQVYIHDIPDGETFIMEGNYFTLNLSELPTVGSTGIKDAFDSVSTATYGADYSNATLIRFFGADNGETTGKGIVNINNMNLIGNANRNQKVDKGGYLVSAGGIIGLKNTVCTMNIKNSIFKAFFITFFPDNSMNGLESSTKTIMNLDHTKCYDSYQNAAFIWSNAELNVNDSYMQRAGGPLVIMQHYEPDDFTTTRIPKLTSNNSIMESYVSGQELWFSATGSTATFEQIKALNAALQPYGLGSYVNDSGKVNLVCLQMCNALDISAATKFTTQGYTEMTGETVLSRMQTDYLGGGIYQLSTGIYQLTSSIVPIFNVGATATEGASTILYFDGTKLCTAQNQALGADNIASYLAAYTQSDYISLNYGGFGLMFGLKHPTT